jgi:small subunit ribosomal protein S2
MNTNHTSEKSLIERLFDVGAHFGFTKSRRHPTATGYIFGNKQGTDIIDLEQTVAALESAKEVCKELGKNGKTILFVGTKEEIVLTVKAHAERAKMPFVVNRWVGGMLTNFPEIRKRIARLKDLVAQGESGELERKYIKKERVVIGRELDKLVHNFSGIQNMDRLPQALIIVDPRHDSIAVEEARALNIPIIGIASSDTNLRLLTHPIVANDGLQSSVAFILDELVTAYTTGVSEFTPAPVARREEVRR